MAEMPKVVITLDPESIVAINRLSAAMDRLNADLEPSSTKGLCCDECGVMLIRPETSNPTAPTFWAAGDLCPFTKECLGMLQDVAPDD